MINHHIQLLATIKMNETKYKGIGHKEINKLAAINPRYYRIASMLLDHILMCFLIAPIAILVFVVILSIGQNMDNWIGVSLMFFPFFIYLNKDFLNGKSVAKRIMGYKVVDRKSEKTASELQCFIRNLLICLIWPIEVLVGLISPERRIGDFLANTKVITAEKQEIKSLWYELKNIQFKSNYVGIIIVGVIYFYGLSQIMPYNPIFNK